MSAGGWTGRAMAAAARGCARRPLTVIVLSVIVAAASLYYTARTITVVTSHLRLLPQNEPYVVRLKEYQRDFGELNDIVIVVESPAPELSKAYAARLVRELGRDGLASDRITYRIDPEYFRGAGLLYLSVDELTKLRERLFDYQEFIEQYAARPTLSRLLEALNQQIANAMVAGFFDLGLGIERSGGDFRFLETVIDQISNGVAGAAAYSSPWSTAFSGGRLDDPDAGYFFSSDRHWLFLLVTQRRQEGDFGGNRGTVQGIRRAIARLGPEYPDVKAGVTGGPAIASDEMTTALDDSQVATVLAIGFTMGLLVLALRRVVKPVVMVAVLLVSLAWSFGIITLVIGHLTIFSVMFISIVVGIGIDYGVYFLFRYEEELSQLPTPIAALARTAERAGPGMLLGALTAAGAFFVLMLTDFQGIREFGFVAGTAILMAFAAMITLFPATLALMDRRRAGTATATATDAIVQRAEWLERAAQHRKTIVAGAIALTAFAVWGATHVGFDYNMLKLQAKGVESVQWEERILAKAGRSGFSALATAADLDELARKQAAFAALPSVAKVESVLMLVPDRQAEKIALIQQFAPLVAQVRVAAATAVEPGQLRGPLDTLRRRLRLATEEGGDRAKQKLGPILAKIETLRGKLVDLDRGRAAAGLERLQVEIARDFADKLGSLQKNLVPRPVRAGDAPPEIRRRFVGSSGRYLLRIHPAVDIWTQAGAERFVTDLRRVDADVTGPPITSFESIRLIRQGYVQGTLYALLLVTVVTAIILRSARGTALALIPLALGVLWTLGFMHVFDLDFNLANVWALPLIIGAAAEFGLNIFVRFQEGRDAGGPVFARSTVMAVVLNGLTTMAGFASLMVAYHRGIFGLGLLLTVGMVASLIAALLVLPVLLMTFLGATRSARSVELTMSRDA